MRSRGEPGFHGLDGFNDVQFQDEVRVEDYLDASMPAADAIRNIVNKHPGKLRALCSKFLRDVHDQSELGLVYSLGGSYWYDLYYFKNCKLR